MNAHVKGLSTLILVLALSACNDDESTSQMGTLSLAITDAPVHNAEEVWIQFSGITVKPVGSDPVDITFDSPKQFDLMTLTGENSETLLNEEPLEAGEYNWIRLDVDAEADSEFDSYVLTDMGEMIELEVVSAAGLQLSSGFVIAQGLNTSFIIDWDLNQALTAPPALDAWLLRPSLRITDETEYGTITGSVADALVSDAACTNDLSEDIGNTVYLFEGAGSEVDDIDGDEGDPLTTAPVTQQEDGSFAFEISFVPPGDYSVAFTCQAMDDAPDADDDIVVAPVQDVTVVDDEDAVVDFG